MLQILCPKITKITFTFCLMYLNTYWCIDKSKHIFDLLTEGKFKQTFDLLARKSLQILCPINLSKPLICWLRGSFQIFYLEITFCPMFTKLPSIPSSSCLYSFCINIGYKIISKLKIWSEDYIIFLCIPDNWMSWRNFGRIDIGILLKWAILNPPNFRLSWFLVGW